MLRKVFYWKLRIVFILQCVFGYQILLTGCSGTPYNHADVAVGIGFVWPEYSDFPGWKTRVPATFDFRGNLIVYGQDTLTGLYFSLDGGNTYNLVENTTNLKNNNTYDPINYSWKLSLSLSNGMNKIMFYTIDLDGNRENKDILLCVTNTRLTNDLTFNSLGYNDYVNAYFTRYYECHSYGVYLENGKSYRIYISTNEYMDSKGTKTSIELRQISGGLFYTNSGGEAAYLVFDYDCISTGLYQIDIHNGNNSVTNSLGLFGYLIGLK